MAWKARCADRRGVCKGRWRSGNPAVLRAGKRLALLPRQRQEACEKSHSWPNRALPAAARDERRRSEEARFAAGWRPTNAKRQGVGMSLKGKTALVTGSTSGIGLGVAHALAQAGCNIILNGLGAEPDIDKARRDLAAHGTRVAFDGANMLRHNQIADMVARAERDFGSLDVLVNNAGIQHVAPVEDFPIEQWDAILAINLSSAFHTTRAAIPGMKRRKWGRIINVCSAHSVR